jgi:hypothetical protein
MNANKRTVLHSRANRQAADIAAEHFRNRHAASEAAMLIIPTQGA